MDKAETTYFESQSGFSKPGAAFATTLWTDVLDAKEGNSPTASQALEKLCRIYWYPLYAFIRRKGYGRPEAEDLTQAFFAHLLEKDGLKTVVREKGKFRSFLLTALTNYLNNHYQKSRAQKRGGGSILESWETLQAEERYLHEPADDVTPERLFEQRWAYSLVELVLSQLRQEYEASGKRRIFDELHPLLVGGAASGPNADLAAELNISAGALKVAIHRLRRRFGDRLREQVASTVDSPDLVDEEIRYLFSVMSD